MVGLQMLVGPKGHCVQCLYMLSLPLPISKVILCNNNNYSMFTLTFSVTARKERVTNETNYYHKKHAAFLTTNAQFLASVNILTQFCQAK